MSMANVLALLGRAIVEDVDAATLRQWIDTEPGLCDAEREDLRRIPPEHLAPYQSDYIHFERDMVQWGFEHTWHALQQLRFGDPSRDGRPPWRAFMVGFRSTRPSRTHSVRETGRHFLDYLREDCGELVAACPWLPELAEMERLEIEVLYAMDNPLGAPLHGTAIDDFFAQPLELLFERQIVRAESVQACTFGFDLPAIKSTIRDAATNATELDFGGAAFRPAPEPPTLAIARDHDTLIPGWYRIDADTAAVLNALPEDRSSAIESWVEQWCTRHENDDGPTMDDAQLLAAALRELHTAFARRLILAAP